MFESAEKMQKFSATIAAVAVAVAAAAIKGGLCVSSVMSVFRHEVRFYGH